MTDEPIDDSARTTWRNQPDPGDHVDLNRVQLTAQKRQLEIRRRDRTAYVSAAIIVPSWIVALWWRPDLRGLAAVGLFVGAWIIYQLYSGSAARLSGPSAQMSCLAFQQMLLERERDLYLRMPKLYLPIIVVGQVAILYTLFTTPRFPKNGVFVVAVTTFVVTVATALVVSYRRWQHEGAGIQRELDDLAATVAQR